jgi:glyoxylase-like metal-dependent hydrolase (beta-lactamase superfamily II)
LVVNTHWHQDHTDGNAPFAADGAKIIAHDAVRRRLAAGQRIDFLDRTVAPAPAAALPVVSFADELTLHLGDRTVALRHLGQAHTDGDVIVVFAGANVIHAGDLVFNRLYPFVDLSSGGSVSGVIRAADELIALCDEKTVVVPGHGPLADRAALVAYRDMLVGVRHRVAGLIAQELDSAAVVAAKPTAAWDEVWGKTWLSGDQFAAIIDASLRAEAGAAVAGR